MTTIIEDEFEADFANFAAVVFAAAEDHDFAYCKSTPDVNEQYSLYGKSGCMDVIKHFYAEIYGKKKEPKLAPKLNMAGSKILERRAKAAEAKVAAASGL
jgi:hypothetical protein